MVNEGLYGLNVFLFFEWPVVLICLIKNSVNKESIISEHLGTVKGRRLLPVPVLHRLNQGPLHLVLETLNQGL